MWLLSTTEKQDASKIEDKHEIINNKVVITELIILSLNIELEN